MKNKITNFFNHAANAPQNTGGGASRFYLRLCKSTALLLMALTLGVGQMWGVDFTPANIVAGASSGNISVSTSASSTSSVKFKNVSNTTVVQISNNADVSPNTNYIEIKAASGYTLSSVVIEAQNNSSDNNRKIVAVFWTGDYNGTTAQAYQNLTLTGNGSTGDASVTVLSTSGTYRTVRIYKRICYNDGTIGSGASGSSNQKPGSSNNITFNVKSITATASGGSETPTAPAITNPASDPDLQTITQGETKTFTVTATGYPSPSFKWYKNTSKSTTGAEEIEGATTDSYTTSATLAAADDPYYFYCVATNTSGTAQSPYFTLQVNPLGSDLTAHTPGIYEKAADKGGYGQTLVTYQDRKYEIIAMTKNNSKNFWFAGTKSSTTSDAHCLSTEGFTTSFAAANITGAWIKGTFSALGSNTGNALDEFPAISSYCSAKITTAAATSVMIKVQGYDQISLYAKDANSTASNNQHLVVKVNGVEQNMTYSTSYTTRRFTLDATTTSVIEITGSTASGESHLVGFSLRLPEPSCSAPTDAAISGTTSYTEGDNISLTASATGATSATFTWYKGADWATASAGTSVGSGATLSINPCSTSDAGTYWCNISNGTGCEVQVSKAITVAAAPADPVITGAVNEAGWGSVSPASITVTSGSTVSIASNVLTCNAKTLTATATAETAEYTYAFSSWSGVTNGQSVTEDLTATAVFTRTAVNYTLAWDKNAEDADALTGGYTSGTVAFGSAITQPNTPTRSGYDFLGWAESAGGDVVEVPATMPAANKTYYAKWGVRYTVTLVPAGGEISDATGWTLSAGNYVKDVASGTQVTLPTFTKANRTFKTWRNGAADVASPITVTANVTLTAVWNATLENVIYSWEGANGGATEVGGTIAGSTTGLINQAQAGYYCLKIDGKADWSSNYLTITLSGEEKVKAGDKIKFTAFYNKYNGETAKTANASFKMATAKSGGDIFDMGTTDLLPHIYNGTGSPANYIMTVPEGINVGIVYITRSQTGSNSWVSKLQIIRETLVEEANLRTATFRYNDGATSNTVVEVASGSKVAEPADPTWVHHRFNEWQLSGSAYDFDDLVTSNITLDATWTQLYTISFANGGGSGDAPAAIEDKAKDETFTVPANTFTSPTGKEFDKWNDGTNDYAPGVTYTVGTANVTLTAVWRTPAAHYTITYNAGAHGTGTIAAGDKTENIAFTLSAERFTRAGYLQTGWAESDGGAKAYDLGGSYSANAAITLYPVWTALDTYTASFACSASAPASWTFSTDESWGDSKEIAAYVCQFVAHSIGTPKTTTGDGTSDDNVAFAKNTNATATYDLGITTTVAALDVTLVGGSSSAFDQTIEYLGADGSTVKKTYTNSLSAGNWKDNAISKTDIVDDVHYIRIHGASKWVVMKDFSVQYIETRTKYNVSFAAGTGASGSMDAVKYIAGAEVTLPECTFTAPTGKEFDAWSSSDVTISNNKFTMPAGNVTITATWKDAITRYAVAYYDGESKLGEEEVENGENPADFEDYQTKSGYNFVGWYNNSDLAEAHKVTIASEVINANANYYGKWALDLQVTKIVFSNGFDAFIKNNTVKAYYMAGESVPTIVSYEGTNLKAEGGVTIDGDNIVLTGTDDSEKELALTLEAVTPMTSYNKQTFDGTETYVKTGYTFTAERGWRISKDLEEASNKRVSEGLCRIYFFLGGGADKATLSSFENRPVKIYVNNVQTSITSVPKQTTFDIPLDPNDATNMVAIVSNGSNGDAGFYDVKLNEHVISSDASLSSLTVNGNAVDLASGELVAGVMTYNYALPYGTVDAPTVAAVANNAFAELGAITQAVSTTGTATFTVTAEDASTQAYAVKFHVSLNPKYVIYDGSTMTNIASRTYSDGTVGFSYTMGNDLPIAGDEVNATLGTKTYTHVVKGFRPDNDPTFSIVVPTGYMAKVYMVIASNSNNSTRTLFVSKTATGTVDTSYGYATSNQQTELVSATSEFLFPDTYYFGTNDGVRLYELSVTLYHIDYPRDVTQGRYGTICLPNGGIMVGAAIFEMAHKTYKNDQPYKVFFDEVINGVMEAGMPYIFMPKEGVTSIAVTYTDNANASAGNYNGLYGTLTKIEGADLYGKYIFSNNSIFMSENPQNWLNANRAYIVLDEVPSNESAPAPGRRRVAMGFNGEQAQEVATGLDETTNDQMINKLLINGQIFILRGEKMYDVTGKLVK